MVEGSTQTSGTPGTLCIMSAVAQPELTGAGASEVEDAHCECRGPLEDVVWMDMCAYVYGYVHVYVCLYKHVGMYMWV